MENQKQKMKIRTKNTENMLILYDWIKRQRKLQEAQFLSAE